MKLKISMKNKTTIYITFKKGLKDQDKIFMK